LTTAFNYLPSNDSQEPLGNCASEQSYVSDWTVCWYPLGV